MQVCQEVKCALSSSMDWMLHSIRTYLYFYLSTEEHQKHLILFLKRINIDQKEALLQVKHHSARTNLFEMIDVLKAYKIFTKIKQSARSEWL